MNKFIPQFEPYIVDNYAERIADQVKSGWVGPSKKTEEFEIRIGDMYHKTAISTTSGTAAIILALSAFNIPKGRIIYFPAYTFLAGANAARFLGYEVQLIDVNISTMCMDPERLSSALKNNKDRNGCVIFVDHNGYCGEDLKTVADLCKFYGIPLLEDSAQCFGIAGAAVTGDISIFSFSVPKIITTGQGGMALSNNRQLIDQMKRIRDHGDNWRLTRTHNFIGINLKFNDILAEYGLAQLDNLKTIINEKIRVHNSYKNNISIYNFGLPFTWMIIYRSKKSDQIIERLKGDTIQAVKYYRPICDNPAYFTDDSFPIAKILGNELVYLPSSINLGDSDVLNICSIINEVEKG